ncbi:uncharacterized protein [Scyliorhinus torazame]|uniref:uncharacterized protein n=1 Tax=Scyliorhinus torazame TaxID=75743 RepID=UPI003B5AE7C4
MEGSDRSPTPCLPKTFFANLHRQQQQDLFCDAVLYAEGEGIPVHRCILAAFSPFFLQRFSSHDAQSQRVPMELPGLKAATLKTLVRFMYTAEAPLPQDETKGFLQAARRLCILGFTGGRRSSPVAEPQGSLTPAGDCMPPLPQPRATVTPVPPQSHPKTPGSSGQGRTPGDDVARTVADCEPKAPAVPASSSPLLQRSRGKCANPPGNPPALSLVASWRRMKVCRPATANPPLCPRRPWRQKRGEPGGDQALPTSHRANTEGSRLPPHSSPSPAPGRRLCPLPETPEYPGSAGVPTGVQPGPRLSDPSQERSGQGSVSQATRSEEEGGEAIESPAEGLAKNAGPLCTVRGLATGSAPASESEQTGPGLPPQERHPDQARRAPTPIGSPQRSAAHPVPARDTRQAAVSHGLPRPEQRRRAVRGPTHQPGTWLGKEGSPPGVGAASEQAVPCPTAPPGTAGPSANPSNQGDVKGANVQRGKRSCCQDIPRDRLLGIKLQKLTHSREWVVIPVPEKQELEPVPARSRDPGTAGQCPGDGGQARTVAGPLVGSHSQTGGARQGLATPGRAGRRKALTILAQSIADSVESDQRPENLVGNHRAAGLGLGSDQSSGSLGPGAGPKSGGLGPERNQSPGGPGLGAVQRSGRPGLGVDQRSGGSGLGVDQTSGGSGLGGDQTSGHPGLGVDQTSGGPGLGGDQTSGGPGLWVDQTSGGPGLGVDQTSGGPGSDQRSGGPGLGGDQRSGGPGLGGDQRSGGPGLGAVQRSGGPGLGSDQRSGGPGLGSDQRSGGPGLGGDQRSGGPGLGSDQRSGGSGLGSDQRSGGPGLGGDQRSGGPGLGGDQRSGGPGLGGDQRSGGPGLGASPPLDCTEIDVVG